jgi:hypothetical protein
VKGKKENKALNELFRHKLENAEIIPSPSVSKAMMRRLARREFLHFNPVRLNIWYTSGVVVIGAALALILSSGPGGNDQKLLSPVSGAINETGVINDKLSES